MHRLEREIRETRENAANSEVSGHVPVHALRHEILAETTARPALPVSAPCICEHLVFLSGELDEQDDWQNMRRLARQLGQEVEAEARQQLVLEGDGFTLKWERHTEFSSYTLVPRGPVPETGTLFGSLVSSVFPEETQKQPLVALRFYVDNPKDPRWTADGERRLLTGDRIAAVRASGGRATVMTDFAIHDDGFSRVLVCDDNASATSTGRLIQRLIDIETYRSLALVAWPLAKSAGRDIGRIDEELRRLIQTIGDADAADQAKILNDLTALAARAETLGAETNFRFSAAKAYYAIVRSRLEELREERIDNYQQYSAFVERRLGPAIRTFQAILDRQGSTSDRIARASSLLRARVDVALEHQNQELLASMDRRSQLQLRLQHTVEGLSVAAVSYYCIGILSWLLKGIPKDLMPVDTAVITTAAAPLIILSVWLTVRRIRRSAHGAEKALSGNRDAGNR